MITNKKTSTKTKKTIVIIGVALILAGLLTWYFISQNQQSENEKQQRIQTEQQEKAQSVNPPSDTNYEGTEKAEGIPDKKIDVTPIITSFALEGDTIDVSAMVTGVVEKGGTCTISINWLDQSREVSVGTSEGPSSTTCADARISARSIPENELITIKLSYSSPGYSGVSNNNPTTTIAEMRR